MLPWLNKEKAISLAVIGDIILDEYISGYVERISPEAPVPILKISQQYLTAGGAANAARNVKLAGGQVHLIGPVGEDHDLQKLKELLTKDEITTEGLFPLNDWPTIRKTRFSSASQQILRVDKEKFPILSSLFCQNLLTHLNSLSIDAILISDYGKGALPRSFLKDILQIARDKKVPVIVDPKGRDYSIYRGCTLITPNYKEACEALGLDETLSHSPQNLGRELQKRYSLNNILITLGPKGMAYIPADPADEIITQESKAQQVYDVSGAGDTVAAIMSLSLASKMSVNEALSLANYAAGRVIAKWGTQAITQQELEDIEKESLSRPVTPTNRTPTNMKIRKGIFLLEDLLELSSSLKSLGKKIVFTNGCFDILHMGHIDLLEYAKKQGDYLLVALNSDQSIQQLKGANRPVVELSQRMRMIAALSCVDFVLSFNELTPYNLIKKIIPDVLIKGDDYKKEDVVGGDLVLNHGGIVKTFPLVAELSTSKILARKNKIEVER